MDTTVTISASTIAASVFTAGRGTRARGGRRRTPHQRIILFSANGSGALGAFTAQSPM